MFKVEITVYGELEIINIPVYDNKVIEAKSCSLEQSFFELWNNAILSDVILVVGPDEERIAAHKCVLMARSPVFYTMFSSEKHDEFSGEVKIPDIEAPELKQMLHFIYTNSLMNRQEPTSNVLTMESIFQAATKFQVPGLIALCETYFIAQLTDLSVLPLLQMADSYGAQHLKLKCLQYIVNNSSTILQLREFSELDDGLQCDASKFIKSVNLVKYSKAVLCAALLAAEWVKFWTSHWVSNLE
jgi:hypothetical protein